jgi:DsbC/DsbD-like thiol-disulfide interchange protein
MRVLPFTIAALAIALASPAIGGETAWQEIAPGVKARLVSNGVLRSDGTTMVGFEIDMPPDTKTYWRIPGETGIPTEVRLEGSTGIAGHTIHWPYPTIDTARGFLDYAYFGPTVLPVEVAVENGAAMVDMQVTLGVCSDICVPAHAEFSLPLDFSKPDQGQLIRIGQAMAETPIPWNEPGEPIGKVWFDPTANALAVAIGDPEVDGASIIADIGNPAILFGTPQKSPDGRTVLLPLLGSSSGAALEGKPVRLTFMTGMGPFETERRIANSASN